MSLYRVYLEPTQVKELDRMNDNDFKSLPLCIRMSYQDLQDFKNNSRWTFDINKIGDISTGQNLRLADMKKDILGKLPNITKTEGVNMSKLLRAKELMKDENIANGGKIYVKGGELVNV